MHGHKYISTRISCAITSFIENRAVYEIMCKSIAEQGRQQMTIWRMRIICWIPKATNTYSDYVILIAFTVQQWFYGRASMLHYTYIACIFLNVLSFLCQSELERTVQTDI